MTLAESYDYMFRVLLEYWNETGQRSRDLGDMLGGFERLTFLGGKPADPAAWVDWTHALRKITPNETAPEPEVRKAIVLLLTEYNDNQGFDLREVIEHFAKLG